MTGDGLGEATLRGAIVGFGEIALGHLEGINATPGLALVAVVDPVAERRAEARRLIPGVATLASVECLPPGLDFIDICAPPASHLHLIAYGLGRGMAVLCEKPLVTRASEAADLARLMRGAAAGPLFPCHNYRYAPAIRALASLTARARLPGEPVHGRFHVLRRGHARGTAAWRPDWRRDAVLSGGGVLQDHGPHSFYIAEEVVGAPLARVRCESLHPTARTNDEVESYALVTGEFADGSVVEMEFDWAAGVRRTVYSVSGGWGTVRLLDDRIEFARNGRVETSRVDSGLDDPRHSAWFAALMSDFASVARMRRQPQGLLGSALRTVRAVDACYASAAGGGVWADV